MKLHRNIFLHTVILSAIGFVILAVYTRMVIEFDSQVFSKLVIAAVVLAILATTISMIIHYVDLGFATKRLNLPEEERFSSLDEWVEADKKLASYPRTQATGSMLMWTIMTAVLAAIFYYYDKISVFESVLIAVGGMVMGSIAGGYNYFFFKLHLAPLRRALAPPDPPPDWRPEGSISAVLSGTFLSICMALTFFPALVFFVEMQKPYTRTVFELAQFIGVVVGLSLFMAVGFIFILRRYLGGAIERLMSDVEAVAEGDFDRRIRVCGDGEIGALEFNLSVMKKRLLLLIETEKALVERISLSVDGLGNASAELRGISGEQAASAAEQASAAQEAGVTSEELKQTSDVVAERIGLVSKMADESLAAATKGTATAMETVDGIRKVQQNVELIANKMVELGEAIQRIVKVADTMDEIAEKTNLLSINAGIEAVGAGEAGERFGVIAAEIRRFAKSTADSADEVRSQVEEIRKGAAESVIFTEEGTKSAAAGLQKVEEAANAFKLMEGIAAKTDQNTQEISMSIKQQTSATEQMAQTMTELNDTAAQVATGAKKIEAATGELDQLAEELKTILSQREL